MSSSITKAEFESAGWRGQPGFRGKKLIERAREALKNAKGVVGIGSPRASLEANHALKQLVGEDCFSTGLSASEQESVELALSVLREGPARTPSLAEVEQADVVLVLGADPTNEAPMLDFAIRQAMRKAPLDIARKLKIPEWDANAVANALQDSKGKLYIAVPWAVKIAEIAARLELLDPVGIVEFAQRISEGIISETSPAAISRPRLPPSSAMPGSRSS